MGIMDIELEGLQTELSTAYTNFFRIIKQLEPDKHSQCGVSGDWSPKDVISHLIGWDKSLQEFIADPDRFNPDPLYDTNTFDPQYSPKFATIPACCKIGLRKFTDNCVQLICRGRGD